MQKNVDTARTSTIIIIANLKDMGLTLSEIYNWEYCGGSGIVGSPHEKHLMMYMATHPNFVKPEKTSTCICNHPIVENCYITDGDRVLTFGNCCIKRFVKSGPCLRCTRCSAVIKRAIKIALCNDCKKYRVCKSCNVEFADSSKSIRCPDCRSLKYCEVCDESYYGKETYCSDCTPKQCEICKDIFKGQTLRCKECSTVKYCSNVFCRAAFYGKGRECHACSAEKICPKCGMVYIGRGDKCQWCSRHTCYQQYVNAQILMPLNLIYPFGKYKGKHFIETHRGRKDIGYVKWILGNWEMESSYPDFIKGIRLMLKFRKYYVKLYDLL